MFRSLIRSMTVVAISLILLSCGSGATSGGGDSIAPPESPKPKAFFNMALPPQGWTSGVVWVNAVHDTRKTGDSSLEVDWVRLHCLVGGQDTLIAGETSANGTGVAWSGLYLRQPWFGDNDFHEPMNVDFTGDIAVLPLSRRLDRVWHFGGSRTIIPAGATLCYAEARVKPQGAAIVQLGLDYWKTDSIGWCGYNICNTEAAGSDWYGESSDWLIISTPRW